jgi:hypothetical protein
LTGNNHLSMQIFISVLQMKSSSTCLITASLYEGPFFYFYVVSSSSNFKHFLESIAIILSVMCLSQNTVNCGITLMLVSLIFLLLVFSWTSEVPQHLCFAPWIKASGIHSFISYYEHYNLVASYVSCCLLLVHWHSFIACITMR